MQVSEAMTNDVRIASPNQTIRDAARAVHGLRVLSARLGDAAQCTTGAARAVGQGNVAE